MAKLTRYDQLVFGSTAGSDQMAQFGSFAAGAPLTYDGSTITPDIVQALSNYLTGWKGAVVGNNSPTIEDMNALCFLFGYQLAYVMQAGIPEYNADTVYYIGSLVNSGGYVYVSLTDANTGNALTSTSNWAQAPQNGVVTPNAITDNKLVITGTSLTWPEAILATSRQIIVQTGAQFVGITSLTLSGTATLTVQGTGVARIL